ncbi:MAG: S8 family peptidase [Bacteroidota bacterium]
MKIDSKIIGQLIFKQVDNNPRFTQDSPVYPDVWMDYFENIAQLDSYRLDLILTPHRQASAALLLKKLLDQLNFENQNILFDSGVDVASNGDTVVAKLTFEEMISFVLPLTKWWKNYLVKNDRSTDDFQWLKRLVGAFIFERNGDFKEEQFTFEAAILLFEQLGTTYLARIRERAEPSAEPPTLWSISRNRQATLSIEESVPATKADASRRLFDIDASNIVWAVLDTGIDITHRAFRSKDPATNDFYPDALGQKEDRFSNHTRVIATYDFTKFRQILSETLINPNRVTNLRYLLGDTSDDTDQQLTERQVNDYITDLYADMKKGRQLDWTVIGPLLRIPHNIVEYRSPAHKHGSHVAGIIAADMERSSDGRKLIGMCPGIRLYDLRVMSDQGRGDEFNILAAIQFVRWMNSQRDGLVIHGINLSLSMKHEVDSYACGQTPVCDACERLVAEGTVVVACAGNQGQAFFRSKEYGEVQGFRTVNITDPGNAENVITVGATHRSRAHSYGVSYFSSKGPTGDGRMKPDLVAPGEKIVSAGFGDSSERMDGTSMAAPHVSGAAALIMAKHNELIGRPKKIKEILCKSATDLGREKYFQGCGMLDVLRAIQSV